MFDMISGWYNKLFPQPPEPPVVQAVAPVAVKKYPVLDKFRQRYSPEYSPCGEELYCNGMLAEDGVLKLYRDRLVPGFPVVEVIVGEEKINLRDCPSFRNSHGVQRHPKWAYAQKKVLDWLMCHDCLEAQAYKYGFWVYDPSI